MNSLYMEHPMNMDDLGVPPFLNLHVAIPKKIGKDGENKASIPLLFYLLGGYYKKQH